MSYGEDFLLITSKPRSDLLNILECFPLGLLGVYRVVWLPRGRFTLVLNALEARFPPEADL
jgi:hypothetical protein